MPRRSHSSTARASADLTGMRDKQASPLAVVVNGKTSPTDDTVRNL